MRVAVFLSCWLVGLRHFSTGAYKLFGRAKMATSSGLESTAWEAQSSARLFWQLSSFAFCRLVAELSSWA